MCVCEMIGDRAVVVDEMIGDRAGRAGWGWGVK